MRTARFSSVLETEDILWFGRSITHDRTSDTRFAQARAEVLCEPIICNLKAIQVLHTIFESKKLLTDFWHTKHSRLILLSAFEVWVGVPVSTGAADSDAGAGDAEIELPEAFVDDEEACPLTISSSFRSEILEIYKNYT